MDVGDQIDGSRPEGQMTASKRRFDLESFTKIKRARMRTPKVW